MRKGSLWGSDKMDTVKIYTNIIKDNMNRPEKVNKLINFGLTAAYYYVSFFKDKRIPKSRFGNPFVFEKAHIIVSSGKTKIY